MRMPWNDEGEEGETLCEKTGMGNTYKAFAKPNADWCLKCERLLAQMPWNDEGEEGETLCEKKEMGNTYKAFAKPNADWCLKCECQGTTKERKGKRYARRQGWETHTKPLPSLTLIGA